MAISKSWVLCLSCKFFSLYVLFWGRHFKAGFHHRGTGSYSMSCMSVLSKQIYLQIFITMSHWSGLRPLTSATPSILSPLQDSSQIPCCCPESWRTCAYIFSGPAPLPTPIVYQWGRCWGRLTQGPGSGPGWKLSRPVRVSVGPPFPIARGRTSSPSPALSGPALLCHSCKGRGQLCHVHFTAGAVGQQGTGTALLSVIANTRQDQLAFLWLARGGPALTCWYHEEREQLSCTPVTAGTLGQKWKGPALLIVAASKVKASFPIYDSCWGGGGSSPAPMPQGEGPFLPQPARDEASYNMPTPWGTGTVLPSSCHQGWGQLSCTQVTAGTAGQWGMDQALLHPCFEGQGLFSYGH